VLTIISVIVALVRYREGKTGQGRGEA
jgi:hypothetical protein